VSAFGQVVSLDLRSNCGEGIGIVSTPENYPEKKMSPELPFIKMLNSSLPPDIRVIGWNYVPCTFDARFSCKYRTYKYFFRKGNMNIEVTLISDCLFY
jgi:tRNA pseudouridine38/39 synthase